MRTIIISIFLSFLFTGCDNPLRARLDGEKAKRATVLQAGAAPAVPGETPLARLYSNYERLRAALAADQFGAVEKIAFDLKSEADRIQGNADAVKKIKEALPQFKTSKEEDLRLAFGKVSEAVVALYKASGGAPMEFYFCPMAKGYGHWVQPKGETISNPYMGQKMERCGTKKDLK